MKITKRKEWRETVRSWGLVPLDERFACRTLGWAMGQACARCWRCASSPDRPPDGADVDEVLKETRKNLAQQSSAAPQVGVGAPPPADAAREAEIEVSINTEGIGKAAEEAAKALKALIAKIEELEELTRARKAPGTTVADAQPDKP